MNKVITNTSAIHPSNSAAANAAAMQPAITSSLMQLEKQEKSLLKQYARHNKSTKSGSAVVVRVSSQSNNNSISIIKQGSGGPSNTYTNSLIDYFVNNRQISLSAVLNNANTYNMNNISSILNRDYLNDSKPASIDYDLTTNQTQNNQIVAQNTITAATATNTSAAKAPNEGTSTATAIKKSLFKKTVRCFSILFACMILIDFRQFCFLSFSLSLSFALPLSQSCEEKRKKREK